VSIQVLARELSTLYWYCILTCCLCFFFWLLCKEWVRESLPVAVLIRLPHTGRGRSRCQLSGTACQLSAPGAAPRPSPRLKRMAAARPIKRRMRMCLSLFSFALLLTPPSPPPLPSPSPSHPQPPNSSLPSDLRACARPSFSPEPSTPLPPPGASAALRIAPSLDAFFSLRHRFRPPHFITAFCEILGASRCSPRNL